MDVLKEYFSSVGISHYAVARYERLRVTRGDIMAREDFVPRCAVLFLLPYYTVTPRNMSRYAASLDYHLIIRSIGEGLCEVLRAHFPKAKMKIYGDHSPIDERHAVLHTGLGLLGENGLVINERYGSYLFIGDLLCDIDPQLLGESPWGEVKHCIGCGRCRAACPSGILRGEGEDCLSAITQRKGELTEDEIAMMRKYNTAWGCDICQAVCPYNRDVEKTPIKAFYEDVIDELTREKLDAMDAQAFRRRAFAWRGRRVVERNLSVLEERE